ncbi:thiosulfate reductase / polysulfide reductase chain A [Natronobacterium gregoryi]|uniref:Anaerobic dehydrogenase, typically selenocysteine-containing n=3 Tax=Natronobacterium gregoryi TaxID=44930 RepID=L0AJT9_NATGS|nr:anaerobic dehydrogenase, typically selenocysteine-containing [Natronobacterium gregoryi SP2]ELY68649.1 molybdopterin oxidoreductase [Natronobacterium gregoryi SP2]PLK20478.1 molybdopterin oxidoreductase [Natronobacterium gregoryi SP2]SFI71614.1 thiosulfate reductase / polysulfide reductase chain A [Natronobacterium gregoryi]
MEVTLENGEAIDLTGVDGHPKASAGEGREGTLCSKGMAQLDKTYNPNRITQPYIREDGELRAADWDEAFSYAADRLQEFADEHGPEKFLRYQGYPIGGAWHDTFFQNIYGAPLRVGRKTTCHGPFSDSWAWMAGYGREYPDYRNSEYMIVWGRNVMESFRGQYQPKGVLDAKEKNDATLVCIDPRYTKTAEVADKWIPIEPRTDGALALAMGHVIIEEGLYDEGFVQNWTYGFDEYRDAVEGKTPEWAEEITGVDADVIREIAIGLAESAPRSFAFPWTGLAWQSNGFKNCQNIHALNGLIGSVDREGGTRMWSAGFSLDDPHEKRGIDVPSNHADKPTPDYDDYPFQRHVRDVSHNLVPKAVERGDLRGMVNNWSAPALSGNTEEWLEAMEEMDLVITIDAFWSAVAERADVVFPGASTLEQPFLDTGGDNAYSTNGWATASDAIIEPIGDCREDYLIYKGLAEEMGYGEYFPWDSGKEYYDEQLEAIGLSFDELAEKSYEIVSEVGYEQWREDGFDTETGKFQFDLEPNDSYAALADEMGASTAPEWHPPDDEHYGETTDDEYPLLVSDFFAEQLSRAHCQALPESLEEYADRFGLAYEEYRGNYLHIHPDDAEPRNISTGDMVRVTSPDGEVELMAHVYEGIRPGFTGMVSGFGEDSIQPDGEGANLMDINKERHVEPVSGMTARFHPVEVTPLGGDN